MASIVQYNDWLEEEVCRKDKIEDELAKIVLFSVW